MSATYDFSDLPDEAVEEFHRQAEICLLGTIQIATAADQRATTLAGIFGAGCIALLAAVATLLTASAPNLAFICASATTAALLFCASALCALAAKPADFHVAGYEPKRLAQSSARDRSWILRFATEDLQRRIDFNRAALVRAARLTAVGTFLALSAVLVGVAVFLIIWFRAGPHFS